MKNLRDDAIGGQVLISIKHLEEADRYSVETPAGIFIGTVKILDEKRTAYTLETWYSKSSKEVIAPTNPGYDTMASWFAELVRDAIQQRA